MEFDNFIKGLRKQNLKSLDYLVDNYSNLIFKTCNAVLNNREISKECVNDVILKVWNNIDSFDRSNEKFAVWILAIAKYTAIDRLRAESKHYNQSDIGEVLICAKENVEVEIISKQEVEEVKVEINNMSNIDKQIFLKKFFDDEKSADIAKSLGLTEKFINLRIFRGRKRLKSKFGIGEV